jgi:hypothetical protein
MRFLPSFCFSRSFFYGDDTPVALGENIFAHAFTVSRAMIFPPTAPVRGFQNICRGMVS